MVKVLCISILHLSTINAKEFIFVKSCQTQHPVMDKNQVKNLPLA